MVIAEVEEIFLKYKSTEEKIQSILRQNDMTKRGLSSTHLSETRPVQLSIEEAKKRNKQILTELELVKGNLRSKAIFSPTEFHWEKVCQQYLDTPSLPVTTWHCHLPVFV